MKLPTFSAYLKSIIRPPGRPKSFLPNITLTLTRSEHRYPNQAVFRCPPFLNKFDIANYLQSIYGIRPLRVNTVNYPTRYKTDLVRLVKIPIPAFKKAYVTLDHEFVYPDTINLVELDAETKKRIMLPKLPKPIFQSRRARKYLTMDDLGEKEFGKSKRIVSARSPDYKVKDDDDEPELVQYKYK